MQPAKIKWKTKSRIDCWNEAKSSNNKKDVISPSQKANPAKTLIQAQHELESTLPKFSENQPDKKALRTREVAQTMDQFEEDEARAANQVANYHQFEVLNTDYECETVPNESQVDRVFDQPNVIVDQPYNANQAEYRNNQVAQPAGPGAAMARNNGGTF